MNAWWLLLLAGVYVGAGLATMLIFVGVKKLTGPDTDQRDPYRLAGRDSDAPAVDLDLALARDDLMAPPPIIPGRDTTP